MCYHALLEKELKKLDHFRQKRLRELDILLKGPAFNGFAHPYLPVISSADPDYIDMYQWGLIPFWAKDNSFQKNTLNAKIETIGSTASYKAAANNRCLMIVDGFFEWQWLDAAGKKKQRYVIRRPDHETFTLGGIWSRWVDPATGKERNTFSVVTTAANKLMAEIHNSKKRMPVVLLPEEENLWLQGDKLENYREREIELEATPV